MTDSIPPTQKALREALALSEDILQDIELGRLPLANAALKASRLARLVNDFTIQKILAYEASGYPTTPTGVPLDVYQAAVAADREFQQKNETKGTTENYIYTSSIEQLEQEVKSAEAALAAARDPDISVSSANPNQVVWSPVGNKSERDTIRNNASRALQRLSSRRSFIYNYVLRRNYELKYSGIAEDIFSRIREKVDSAIGQNVPDAVQKLAAVYENLRSENPEDWSNAVHSCRRILQDLADAVYPPRADVTIEVDGKPKTIKLGTDHYVNRLIAFIDEKSQSERFAALVGSHISFIGNRLDSVFRASQKGSHSSVSKDEADRYVVYTYLIVGDILTLL